MTQSELDKWHGVRARVRALPELRNGMQAAPTVSQRHLFTRDYVAQIDHLLDLMVELDQSGTLDALEAHLEGASPGGEV